MHCYNLFCSHLMFIQWLQNHLIPCPFKKLTGYDCPGCGFQRSIIALVKGHLHDSLLLYPATIPLLITFVLVLLDGKLSFDQRHIAKKTLYIITGNIILFTYLYKLYNL